MMPWPRSRASSRGRSRLSPRRPIASACCARTVTPRWGYGRYGIRRMGCSMTSLERSEEANMRRKRNEPPPKARMDEPFGPPPIEYLSRCSVCGEEMLVNEAIIDVAIGAAKFRGEYQGRMPTIGCPGCNGETMEYVDQES